MSHYQRIVTLYDLFRSSLEISIHRASLHLTWLRDHSVRKILLPTCLLRIISSNCTTLQLPVTVTAIEANKNLAKKTLKRKSENELSVGDLEMLYHIPGIYKAAHMFRAVHMLRKHPKSITSSSPANLDNPHKCEMKAFKQSCKLTATSLKACPNLHIERTEDLLV